MRFTVEQWRQYQLRKEEPRRFIFQAVIRGDPGAYPARVVLRRPDGTEHCLDETIEVDTANVGFVELLWGEKDILGEYGLQLWIDGELAAEFRLQG